MKNVFRRVAAGAVLVLLMMEGEAGAGTSRFSGTWVLTDIGGRPVNASESLFFAIDGLEVRGFDGCNRFSGRLGEPGGMMSTRRGCPEGALRLPLDLGHFQAHLETGRVAGNRLVFEARGEFPSSVFSRRQ